ncbi:class I SAM-dependent methyltransferase [Actinomadura violacea]|uniref:Methyltransferase domain-containing protein n=1 Tax=Actinomadura violacea TaxID=2819934 RepID=A0ABS3S559_9ACTN|nr:class I SAM-dependent methyltransferase [Actinomadura violacea]MBO2464137.1 methyltransferase domain-containing protein [Actinomadura violacea]
MSPTITDQTTYWDHYAEGVPDQPLDEALRNAFGWTQYPGHGPGDELLGHPATVLELGSGRGDAIAALATKGITATGLDISPAQCEKARTRWAHLSKAHFEHGDVLDYLATTTRRWDTIYSIWGAVWFTNPEDLLPLIHDHLTPGGKLVFSHAAPVPGAYGIQGTYATGLTGRQVWLYRWSYEPATWATILETHGFTEVEAIIEPAPTPHHIGTLLAQACKGTELPHQRPFWGKHGVEHRWDHTRDPHH